MKASSFNTVSVGQLKLTAAGSDTPSAESKKTAPTFLCAGATVPLRILVRNISFAAELYLSFDSATLQDNEPGSETYFLPAGAADVVVLAPGQKLYAISLSTGARACLAISEALPADKM